MKAKQWQEIRSMSVAELESKLQAAREQLFRIQFRHAATPMKNGLEIRKIRRSIAQFITLLREKNVATAQAAKK